MSQGCCTPVAFCIATDVLQVRSLLGQIRPDRQTLLFSATMPRKVESLVRDAVSEPVRITVGGAGANEDIRQVYALGHHRRADLWTARSSPSKSATSMFGSMRALPEMATQLYVQVVEVVPAAEKLAWLLGRLPGFIDAGDVLVFANQKAQVDELAAKILAAGFR